MGLCVHCDALFGAESDERFHHVVRPCVLDPGGQLAVRECACAALAEHDVAVGVRLAAAPEGIDIPLAFGDGLAPFEDDDAVTEPCKLICRKQAAGAKPHDHDRSGLGYASRYQLRLGFLRSDGDIGEPPCKHAPAVRLRNIERNAVKIANVALVARIERAVDYFEPPDDVNGQPGLVGYEPLEHGVRRIERQTQIGQQKSHCGLILSFRWFFAFRRYSFWAAVTVQVTGVTVYSRSNRYSCLPLRSSSSGISV